MEKVLKEKLVYKTPFLYYDDHAETYSSYEKVAKSGADNFKFMSSEEISKTFAPMPNIKSKYIPIVDTNAGIIAADTFILKMRDYLMSCPNVTVS
jgi:hypothetical protein